MARWLSIRDGKVVGYAESSSAEVPVGDGITEHVAVTTEQLEAYRLARQNLSIDGRNEPIGWDGSAPVVQQDLRPNITFTVDRAIDAVEGAYILDADGVDSITLTVTVVNKQGATNTNVNGRQILAIERNGQVYRLKLNFVAGVASKVLRTNTQGEFLIESTPRYRVQQSVSILAVD